MGYMKRGWIFVLVIALFFISFVSAEAQCDLGISMIQQDPYPAVPGEYVKVVFQVDGISNSVCKDVVFKIIDSYPFSLDSEEQREISLSSGGFVKNYGSFALVPYRLRVDKGALDGENEIGLEYRIANASYSSAVKDFNITIENPLPSFEVFVRDYSYDTGILSLSVLNIGERDAKTVTLQIPTQDNVIVIGKDQEIIGDMDSQSDELTSYVVDLTADNFNVILKYTDDAYSRRTETVNVKFNPDNFKRNVVVKKPMSAFTGFIIGMIITLAIIFGFRYYKKRKQRNRDLLMRNKR